MSKFSKNNFSKTSLMTHSILNKNVVFKLYDLGQYLMFLYDIVHLQMINYNFLTILQLCLGNSIPNISFAHFA